MSGSTKVTFYVQIAPEWYDGVDSDGRRELYAARAVRMTARQPENPISGAVVVPVTLWVPREMFGPQGDIVAQVIADGAGNVELQTGAEGVQ